MIPDQILNRLQIVQQTSSANSIERPHRIVVEALGEDDQDSRRTSNDSSLSLLPGGHLSGSNRSINASAATQANRLGQEAATADFSRRSPYARHSLLTSKYMVFQECDQSPILATFPGGDQTALRTISRLPTADSLSSLLSVPQLPRRSTVTLIPSLATSEIEGNSGQYYCHHVLRLVEVMQARGTLDNKAHLGLMALKKLTQLKNQLLDSSNSSAQACIALEQSVRKGVAPLSAIERAISDCDSSEWAKQDWAFLLLTIDVREALLGNEGNSSQIRKATKVAPLRLKVHKAIPRSLFGPTQQLLRILEQDEAFFTKVTLRKVMAAAASEEEEDVNTFGTEATKQLCINDDKRPLSRDQKIQRLKDQIQRNKVFDHQDCSYL